MAEIFPIKVEEAERAADRFLQHRRREEVLAVVVMVLFAIVAVGGYLGYRRQSDISDGENRVECIARITAGFQGAVADAFDTPPAPNPERAKAVTAIESASRQLKNLNHYCH